jgi:hypothetical protein
VQVAIEGKTRLVALFLVGGLETEGSAGCVVFEVWGGCETVDKEGQGK